MSFWHLSGGEGGGGQGYLASQTSSKMEWGLVTIVVLGFAFMLGFQAEGSEA